MPSISREVDPAGPRVTVTIVAFNSASCIENAITSIADDISDGFAKLVVVDNASPDDSVEVAKRACSRALIVRAEANRYFAAGCNLAWPHVEGAYWLLLNPDVEVPSAGLQDLVAWMDAHPDVGAASPNLMGEGGGSEAPARRFPSVSLTLLEMSRLHKLMPPERRAARLLGSYMPWGETLDVDWVVGAAMIVRRDAVNAAGLLSERVAMYGEDSEWCWRIRRAGYRVALVGGRPWRHQFAVSTRRTWEEGERLRRTLRGIYHSDLMRRGAVHAAALWAITLVAILLEAVDPRRPTAQRRQSLRWVRGHLALARAAMSAQALRSLVRRRAEPEAPLSHSS